MPGWFGPRIFATADLMAMYISALGFRRGSISTLAVWSTLFGSWLLRRASIEHPTEIDEHQPLALAGVEPGECVQVPVSGAIVGVHGITGQVPPYPDHFCATTSRSVRRNLD
jgi:hypothetical protein